MSNLQLTFTHPWLLLLLIPAFAVVLIPYFLMSKKYRRNRNRITAVVLHICVLVCCVFLLAGLGFKYEVPNSENEILLVVDASYSTDEEKAAKDEYVKDVIAMTDPDVYKLGIVTFGFDQQYAAQLSNDLGTVYNEYVSAFQPDTSATDIAAALTYAKDLFNNPETGKIVLISDGVETDERASAVIRSIVAEGIRVDTVACAPLSSSSDAQLVSVDLPDYNVVVGEKFEMTLNISSTFTEATEGVVAVYDNGTRFATLPVSLVKGSQTVVIEHEMETDGLHTLSFELDCDKDEIEQNNVLNSYMYLNIYDNILVIEGITGESAQIQDLLADYNVTVLSTDEDELPADIDAMRAYDEVILNNVSNADLQKHPGFDELLNQYVYEVGGGLFTVGGSEPGDPATADAHAYNREDMAGSLYQQMLPVQAIDYTPPLGLMIVIDVSGSMTMDEGDTTKLDAAKNTALSIVRDETCLSDRDYCGIMTLSDSYTVDTSPLPMTRQYEIEDVIANIREGSSTIFTPAVERSGMELRALYDQGVIEKMHVIIITDGGAADFEDYISMVERYNMLGVTYTFVGISPTADSFDQLEQASVIGGTHAINASIGDLTQQVKDNIRVDAIKEVEYGDFVPTVNKDSSYASVISQEDMPTLGGFYGTRARNSDYVVLSGEYGVPIYAEWKYGAGTVGSFMCDLTGEWSADFLAADGGRNFLLTVVTKLFPTHNIRQQDITAILNEENYITQISIYTATALEEGESVEVSVENLTNPYAEVRITQPSAAESYSRSSFVASAPGVYRITVRRLSVEGALVCDYTVYKAFSYSSEYIPAESGEDYLKMLESLSTTGGGSASQLSDADPWDTFRGFVTSLQRSYDPRLALAITAIVLFLLDIAVRKFKFKWPHEIIRDFKNRKEQK